MQKPIAKELIRQQKEAVSHDELINDSHLATDYLIDAQIITSLIHELKKDCRDILTEYYFNNRSIAELKDIFYVNCIQAA